MCLARDQPEDIKCFSGRRELTITMGGASALQTLWPGPPSGQLSLEGQHYFSRHSQMDGRRRKVRMCATGRDLQTEIFNCQHNTFNWTSLRSVAGEELTGDTDRVDTRAVQAPPFSCPRPVSIFVGLPAACRVRLTFWPTTKWSKCRESEASNNSIVPDRQRLDARSGRTLCTLSA